MSLKDMIAIKENSSAVLEFSKFGPNNSDIPINIWFDNKHHENSPRIKIQSKKGSTKSDDFISFSPVNYEFIHKNTSKRDSIPNKILNDVVNFVKTNEEVVDRYYGIDRSDGTADVNRISISEDEFRTRIIKAATDYFGRK